MLRESVSARNSVFDVQNARLGRKKQRLRTFDDMDRPNMMRFSHEVKNYELGSERSQALRMTRENIHRLTHKRGRSTRTACDTSSAPVGSLPAGSEQKPSSQQCTGPSYLHGTHFDKDRANDGERVL